LQVVVLFRLFQSWIFLLNESQSINRMTDFAHIPTSEYELWLNSLFQSAIKANHRAGGTVANDAL